MLFYIKKYKAMKNKILLGVSILFGLMFINSGLNKFFNYMPMPKDMPEDLLKAMGAFMQIGWLMPLVAVAEITGGILFMTNKFRALGAIIIFPVLVGILLTHIFIAPSGLPLALVFLAIEIWVIVENREKYLPMIR
jgi:putative oxidoreductase